MTGKVEFSFPAVATQFQGRTFQLRFPTVCAATRRLRSSKRAWRTILIKLNWLVALSTRKKRTNAPLLLPFSFGGKNDVFPPFLHVRATGKRENTTGLTFRRAHLDGGSIRTQPRGKRRCFLSEDKRNTYLAAVLLQIILNKNSKIIEKK